MLGDSGEQPYTYSQLLEDAGAGKIESITMDGDRLTVKLKATRKSPSRRSPRLARRAPRSTTRSVAPPATRQRRNARRRSQFNPVEPSAAGSIITLLITALLPVLLIGAFIFFMMRQAQGTNNQAMSFGKSRARMFMGNKPSSRSPTSPASTRRSRS